MRCSKRTTPDPIFSGMALLVFALVGCLDRASVLDPDLTGDDAALVVLLEAYQAGQCEKVIEIAPTMELKRDERSAAVNYRLAQCLYRNDRFQEAEATFSALARSDFVSRYAIRSLYFVGRSQYRLRNFDQAFATFQEFHARYPTNTYAIRALYYSGRVRYRQDRFAESVPFFEEARTSPSGLGQERYLAASTFYAGRARYRVATDDPVQAPALFAVAQARVEEVLANYPTSSYADNAAYIRARIFYEQDRYAESRDALNAFLQTYTDPDNGLRPLAHYFWARSLERLDQLLEALEQFQQHEVLFPTSPFVDNALYHQGRTSFRLGRSLKTTDPTASETRLNQAKTLFESVNTRFPQSFYQVVSRYYVGRSWYELGSFNPLSFEQARLVFADATFGNPLQPETLTAYYDNVRYYTGRAFYEEARYTEARQVFAEPVLADVTNVYHDNALYFTGRSYYQENDYVNARLFFEKPVLSVPTSVYYDNTRYYIGRTYYRQGKVTGGLNLPDLEQSLVFFDLVVGLQPVSFFRSGALYFGARALQLLDRNDQALPRFNELLAFILEADNDSLYLENTYRYIVELNLNFAPEADRCTEARAALQGLKNMFPQSLLIPDLESRVSNDCPL